MTIVVNLSFFFFISQTNKQTIASFFCFSDCKSPSFPLPVPKIPPSFFSFNSRIFLTNLIYS
ncbi:hypothetical protein HanXRQr2_Chr16g0778471 [Helianthus annuus]|uniref:Uncharacterized protein n=1 Tax=Helianthus annuus TaxID=4232 RepID=A0A9K3DYF2_HELAN|nr:hypothetical protein HanXRQr2_Chr16g0778471 [Helianthus annuus]